MPMKYIVEMEAIFFTPEEKQFLHEMLSDYARHGSETNKHIAEGILKAGF
jgi:hypothetical protein